LIFITLKAVHRGVQWVEQALLDERAVRDDRWSEAIGVGSLAFVDKVRSGFKGVHRQVTEVAGTYTLREQSEPYAGDLDSESERLSLENTIFWDENAETAET
jgi:hypothetical protein